MMTPHNRSIAITLAALAIALFNPAANAEPVAKALDSGPGKTARQVFRQTAHGAEWRVQESDGCHIHVSYRSKARKSGKHIAMDDCSAITHTEYKLLGDVLVANWASERGGYAYVFHAAGHDMQWLELHYDSSDESAFTTTRSASTLFIKTDRSDITIRVSDEKLERLEPGKTR